MQYQIYFRRLGIPTLKDFVNFCGVALITSLFILDGWNAILDVVENLCGYDYIF